MNLTKFFLGFVASLLGVIAVFVTGIKSFFISSAILLPVALAFFFKHFELSVIGLLVVRSSLDPFSEKGLTSVYAIVLSALTVLYVFWRLLFKQKVQIDAFWCFFAGWIVLQGLWVILLPLGGLGFGSEHLSEAGREWVRILSWLMTYLLVLQLKGRVAPETFVNCMLLALIVPISDALMQIFIPGHFLPSFLAVNPNQDGFRVNGTLGVSNTFSTFLVFYIGLLCWKITVAKKRLPWIILLATLALILVNTRTLVGIPMVAVLMAVVILPRLNLTSLLGTVLLFVLVGVLLMSTDYGRSRIASISETPLLNPSIDVSRAVLLSAADSNSFNWRVAQWTALLSHWRYFPIFGYGLQTANGLGPMFAYAHNDYVRVLVEEGIAGFTLFLTFLGVQFFRLSRLVFSPATQRSQRTFCTVMVAFLISAMVGMLTENVWSHTALFFYWFALSAVADWSWEQTTQNEPVLKTVPRLSHFSP